MYQLRITGKITCGLFAVLCFCSANVTLFARGQDEMNTHPATTSRGLEIPMERRYYDTSHSEGITGRLFPNIHGGDAVHFDYLYSGGVFTNTRGGVRKGMVYNGIAELSMTADTEKLGLWKNGTFYSYSIFSHGPTISDSSGDYQGVTVFAYETPAQVAQYWYQHSFLDGKVIVKLGKQDTSADFFVLPATANFVNSSATCIPTTSIPAVPDSAWGVAGWWEVTDNFCLKAGIYDAHPFGDAFWISDTGNAYSSYQIERHHSLANRLPGFTFFGAWYDSSSMELLGSGEERTGRYGFATGIEQMVYRRNARDKEDMRGLTAFFQYGWTEKNQGDLKDYFGTGFQFLGLFESRPNDSLGFSVNIVRFSDGYRKDEEIQFAYEAAYELYYKIQLTENCVLQPDFQYIVHPGGEYKNSFVPGVIFQVVF
ncbi:MAG: carbohydrate porin [Planctomycetaceae bacterium]|jgi:porin|nr:carbohydrate porin [Planctomycetaceae bacterium]